MVTGSAGCLLMALIAGNFLFGWLIFAPLLWIAVEFFLLLCLRLYVFMVGKKAGKAYFRKPRRGVIDVEGEVVEEEK